MKDWTLHVSSYLILKKSANENLLLIHSGSAANSVWTPSSSPVATQTLSRVSSGKTFSIHSTEKRGPSPRFTQFICNAETIWPKECFPSNMHYRTHQNFAISFVIALLIPLVYLHFPKIPDWLNLVSQNDWCTHKFWQLIDHSPLWTSNISS